MSRTDPESGSMVRDGKPKGFFYLDHLWSSALAAPTLDFSIFRAPPSLTEVVAAFTRVARRSRLDPKRKFTRHD
ncbi:hypothetical protein [Rhizobium mongolense]|uniref:Uncharacterized protein n=1 Tax=Rhizobium mongolense TaxID=57676 RepID=A0A7W6RHJ3_9HYPH|nr:hypothetical protein [Rhizobium mongolense]MBB4272591.1 hypothetical protein [Rhizobium mongolense]